MMTKILAALAFVATAVAVPAANAHDDCNAALTLDLAGQAYVSQDQPGGIPLVDSGLWVYLEANGIAELQRGGVTLLGDADTCQASTTPDLGVF